MDVLNADVKVPGNFAAHNQANAKVLEALHVMASESGLALDPDAGSYALMDAHILQLPAGLDALAVARRHFDSIVGGEAGAAMREDLGEQLGIASARMELVFHDLTRTYAMAAPQDKATIADAEAAMKSFAALLPQLRAAGTGTPPAAATSAAVSKQAEELTETLASMQDKGMETLEKILNRRVANEQRSLITHVAVTMLALALAVAIALSVTRYLSSQVNKANAVFTNMSQGRFDNVIEDQAGDELGVLLVSLRQMQKELREKLDAERVVGLENARIRQALDATTSNVMVADDANNIIYLNRSALELMGNAQSDFRVTLPGFDSAKLLGTNIDAFHVNPPHQRGLLSRLDKTFTSQLKIGGRTMKIIANPIVDAAGKRLGTVVEWSDRTQELAIEAEVQHIVTEAVSGKLDRRIALDGKAGFFHSLSAGLNELVGNVAEVGAEVQALVAAVNEGNLARRIRTEGKSG